MKTVKFYIIIDRIYYKDVHKLVNFIIKKKKLCLLIIVKREKKMNKNYIIYYLIQQLVLTRVLYKIKVNNSRFFFWNSRSFILRTTKSRARKLKINIHIIFNFPALDFLVGKIKERKNFKYFCHSLPYFNTPKINK